MQVICFDCANCICIREGYIFLASCIDYSIAEGSYLQKVPATPLEALVPPLLPKHNTIICILSRVNDLFPNSYLEPSQSTVSKKCLSPRKSMSDILKGTKTLVIEESLKTLVRVLITELRTKYLLLFPLLLEGLSGDHLEQFGKYLPNEKFSAGIELSSSAISSEEFYVGLSSSGKQIFIAKNLFTHEVNEYIQESSLDFHGLKDDKNNIYCSLTRDSLGSWLYSLSQSEARD